MEIFRNNLKKIEMHNYLHDNGKKSYRLGINQFADMEAKEFASLMNGFRMTNKTKVTDQLHSNYLSPALPVNVPSEVDWRKEGYVTAVKNQVICALNLEEIPPVFCPYRLVFNVSSCCSCFRVTVALAGRSVL